MKKKILIAGLMTVGFALGNVSNIAQANGRTSAVAVNLCALKKTGVVRYTTRSCKSTEKSVALDSEYLKWDFYEQLNKSLVPTLKTKRIVIDYLGIPNSSWSTPGCGSTATSFDASGNSIDALYGYWIFGAGINPPSRMSTLTIDPLVLTNGSNWKQVAKCRLEVTVVVPG
jgi:hypothetical protein